jgi:hypothetical protein
MQIADAIVTGFAKSPQLIEQSFAPLRQLRSEGVLRHIYYVTWDSPDLDSFVAPIAVMDDVITARIPQRAAEGVPAQRNQSRDGRPNDLESRLCDFKASNAHFRSAGNGPSAAASSEPAKTVPTSIAQGAAA